MSTDPKAQRKANAIGWAITAAICLGIGLFALAGNKVGNDYADCVDSYGSDWCHQQTVNGKSIQP